MLTRSNEEKWHGASNAPCARGVRKPSCRGQQTSRIRSYSEARVAFKSSSGPCRRNGSRGNDKTELMDVIQGYIQ